jgi:hypothetical protein
MCKYADGFNYFPVIASDSVAIPDLQSRSANWGLLRYRSQ